VNKTVPGDSLHPSFLHVIADLIASDGQVPGPLWTRQGSIDSSFSFASRALEEVRLQFLHLT
jgi:hypothetical protein